MKRGVNYETVKVRMYSSMIVLISFFTNYDVGVHEKKTIYIGSPFKSGHILVDVAGKLKEPIEKESGERLALEVQAEVASEEDMNDWCSKGKIEMQSNGHRPIEIFVPQIAYASYL